MLLNEKGFGEFGRTFFLNCGVASVFNRSGVCYEIGARITVRLECDKTDAPQLPIHIDGRNVLMLASVDC